LIVFPFVVIPGRVNRKIIIGIQYPLLMWVTFPGVTIKNKLIMKINVNLNLKDAEVLFLFQGIPYDRGYNNE